MTTKTEVRKKLSGYYRTHWVNAFLTLAFDKNLSVDENYEKCFKWLYDGRTWTSTQKGMGI